MGKIKFVLKKMFLKYVRLLKKNNRGCGCDTHKLITVAVAVVKKKCCCVAVAVAVVKKYAVVSRLRLFDPSL